MTEQWQRVSPIAIIYFLISSVVKFVKDVALNMMPAVVVLLVSVKDKMFWLSSAGITISLLLVLGSILYYITFRYKVADNQIIVHKGIFNKEDITLKFERIQNINISTPWYFTSFNLVNCILDSAGSTAKEISIPGIDASYAEKLSKRVHQYNQSHDSGLEEKENLDLELATMTSANNQPTLIIGPREIIKYSLTNSVVVIVAAALFPIYENIISKFDINVKAYLNEFVAYLPIPKFAAILLVLFILLLMSLTIIMSISIISSLIKFYRFEFYNELKKLRRVAGLLERHQISIRKQKIQGITIKQNLIARLFNRVTIQVHQTQTSQFNPTAGSKQNFLIPMLNPEKWQEFVGMSFSSFIPQELTFQSIDKNYIYRNFFFFTVIPVLALTIFMTYKISAYHLSWLILLPLGYLICWQKHRRYGIWFNDQFIITRSGFLGTDYCVFPFYKLQQVALVQTLLQQKKHLIKIKFQLAFIQISIPYLSQYFAEIIANRALYKIESSNNKWL